MIRFTAHALERMAERGATRNEVEQTIFDGDTVPARHGRIGFRYTFPFNAWWNGQYYAHKQLTVYTVEDGEDSIAITVLCRYF